jgi:hypothetical protein
MPRNHCCQHCSAVLPLPFNLKNLQQIQFLVCMHAGTRTARRYYATSPLPSPPRLQQQQQGLLLGVGCGRVTLQW